VHSAAPQNHIVIVPARPDPSRVVNATTRACVAYCVAMASETAPPSTIAPRRAEMAPGGTEIAPSSADPAPGEDDIAPGGTETAPGSASAASRGNGGEKRKAAGQFGGIPLSPEDAESFMRRLKRACLSHGPEAYRGFCDELGKAAAKAKEAAEASKFEEEAAITRQLLLDVEPAFAGQRAYYFEFLRMLPPSLVPKLADDEAAEKEKTGSEGGAYLLPAPPRFVPAPAMVVAR
jgi:hypothetical protein